MAAPSSGLNRSVMRRSSILSVLVLATLLLASAVWAFIVPALDFDAKVAPRAGTVRTLTIQNFAFNPPTLVATLNDTVRIINGDSVPHTVTSDQGLFDTGIISIGKSKRGIAKRRGTFPYHCSIHPFMRGTIVVQ